MEKEKSTKKKEGDKTVNGKWPGLYAKGNQRERERDRDRDMVLRFLSCVLLPL